MATGDRRIETCLQVILVAIVVTESILIFGRHSSDQ
jgi:hypothetical protein